MKAEVDATNAAGTTATWTNGTSTVTAGAQPPAPAAPAATVAPAINGLAVQGQTLSVSDGHLVGQPHLGHLRLGGLQRRSRRQLRGDRRRERELLRARLRRRRPHRRGRRHGDQRGRLDRG